MRGRFVDIFLLFSLLASLTTLGVFFYGKLAQTPSLPVDEEGKNKLLMDSRMDAYPDSYRLDRLIINLKSPATRLWFLDTQIYIVPFGRGKHELFNEYAPLIYDAINRIGGGMTPDELNSIHGKIIFKNRVKDEINRILREKVVKEIQYSKFTVQ